MRLVIQRVKSASVAIGGETRAAIGQGLLVLVGVREGDAAETVPKLARKTAELRIFEDGAGKMNLSALDIGGGALVVPNFTLFADTRKGSRPSFVRAAHPPLASDLFDAYCAELRRYAFSAFGTGVFGADMQLSLVNDGPVTIVIDTDEWTQ